MLLVQSIQLRDMHHPDRLHQFSQTCELASTQNTQHGAFSLAVFFGNGKEQVCSVEYCQLPIFARHGAVLVAGSCAQG